MSNLTDSPQRIAAQYRKAFRSKFPSAHVPLMRLARSICHPYRYGYYSLAYKAPIHRNSALTFLWSLYPKKLTISTISRHFGVDSDEDCPKSEFVWYINVCPIIPVGADQLRFALIQFDIDDHDGSGDAGKMLSHLQVEIPLLAGAYSEPSTNGSGIHLYAPLSFPAKMNRADIRACLDELQDRVKEISEAGRAAHGVGASCKEVRGRPSIMDPFDIRKTSYAGELVKLPRPDTDKAALDLIKVCSDPIPWDRWEDWLHPACSINNWPQGATTQDRGEMKSLQDLRAPSERVDQQLEEQGSPIHIDRGEIQTLKSSQGNNGDAFQRTLAAGQEFERRNQRAPTGDELLRFYELNGYATGPRTRRRQNRCDQVARHLAQTLDRSKLSADPLLHLEDVRSRISDEEIAGVWSSKVSCLKHDDIALVLFLIRQKATADKPHAFSKKYFLSASRKLKAEGRVKRCLDHKRIGASKKLLVAKGYIEIVKVGKKGRGASLIRVASESQPRLPQ